MAVGQTQQSRELAGKRLELLREIQPSLRGLAVMGNAVSPGFALEISDIQAMTRTLGLDVAIFEIRRAEDIALVARLPTVNVQREYVEFGDLLSYGASYLDLPNQHRQRAWR
jgi:putative ABC transport system substrate-binding protein